MGVTVAGRKSEWPSASDVSGRATVGAMEVNGVVPRAGLIRDAGRSRQASAV